MPIVPRLGRPSPAKYLQYILLPKPCSSKTCIQHLNFSRDLENNLSKQEDVEAIIPMIQIPKSKLSTPKALSFRKKGCGMVGRPGTFQIHSVNRLHRQCDATQSDDESGLSILKIILSQRTLLSCDSSVRGAEKKFRGFFVFSLVFQRPDNLLRLGIGYHRFPVMMH